MAGPNPWLLTGRIVVYNEVLLGRSSLERLPIGVLLWTLSGTPLYANGRASEWLALEPVLPTWSAFWRRFAGADDPPDANGQFGTGDAPPFLYVTDRVRNLEGQDVARAVYVSLAPAQFDTSVSSEADGLGAIAPSGDRTLALMLFRDGRLSAWTPLSPRWPPIDRLAGRDLGAVLEFLSREVEAERAPQFVPARESLSDGSVLLLAQAVDEHAAAGAALHHNQLVAATAHEIRNPLATIRGFLQILPGALPDERQRYAEIALREVDRITAVVNDFLQGGTYADAAAAPVDLAATVRAVVELVEAEAAGAGLDIVFEALDPEVLVRGRATRLAQVVSNLLHNAVQTVNAPGGRVWVTVAGDDAWARVVVEDDGPGVPEEWRSAVFEPDFSRRPGGHGLGLAIARWIVTSHGGRIALGRSRAGGARFEVVLPRVQGQPASSPGADTQATAPSA